MVWSVRQPKFIQLQIPLMLKGRGLFTVIACSIAKNPAFASLDENADLKIIYYCQKMHFIQFMLILRKFNVNLCKLVCLEM